LEDVLGDFAVKRRGQRVFVVNQNVALRANEVVAARRNLLSSDKDMFRGYFR
jgi:hypothetical protein